VTPLEITLGASHHGLWSRYKPMQRI
jgi:hypothetical protein